MRAAMMTVALALALTLAAPASAQDASPTAPAPSVAVDPALTRAIAGLQAFLAGTRTPDTVFASTFLAKVPPAQVTAIATQLTTANGPVGQVESVTPTGPRRATVRIAYPRATATMQVGVEAAAPHRIETLLITGMTAREATLDAVRASLAALPGSTGLAVARLGQGAPTMLTAAHADQAFAIGSEFKLVILAELVRAVAAGERRWTDTVTLDGTPLPGGGYTQKPAGTAVPIRELAERMIAVSDNSATDILLRTLGRTKVEAMLPVLGIAHPAGMRPFLGTLEVFKLKGIDGGRLGRRWASLDEAGRRRLLATEVAHAPHTAIDQTMFAAGRPLQIATAEWFATPADMVRVMDWLRRHTESGPAAEARAILSANPGPATGGNWLYAGYKGGSEPGVIAMTLLLQRRSGEWLALSASWNDPTAPVDDTRFAALIARAAELLAAE